MAGEGGSLGARSTRIRPHWWAVLAVSLSLLALVAATSSNRPSVSGDHGPARDAAAHGPARAAAAGGPARDAAAGGLSRGTGTGLHPQATVPPSPTTTTVPPAVSSTTMPPTTTPTTPTRTPTPAVSDAARVIVQESTATTTTTTTTTTVPTIPPETGSLQQPDDASATYQFAGAGSMEVSASWTPTTPLSLTVSCPAGIQQKEGSSSISVVIPDADGPCVVTLKELLVQYDAVSYALTFGPAGG